MPQPAYAEMSLSEQAIIDALAAPGTRAVSIHVEAHLGAMHVTQCISQHPQRERAGFLRGSDTRWHLHIHCVPADVSDQDLLRLVRQVAFHRCFSVDYWQLGPGKIITGQQEG